MVMVPIQTLMGLQGGKGWKGGSSHSKVSKKDTSGGELGEHIGTIKSTGTKYSFIECEALQEHGDVFLFWDELKAYKKGQKVKFTAFLNKEGKVAAKDLKSGLKTSTTTKTKAEPQESFGEQIGTIKSTGNKFSFIECDALSEYGDVFVHWEQLKAYRKGQKVKFTAFLNTNGKVEAKNLKSGLK